MITLAIPKGRLNRDTARFFSQKGMGFSFDNRKLITNDESGRLKIFLVKNSDVATYLHYGIAGLSICGDDSIMESGHNFYKIMTLPFGSTKMCLAARKSKPDKTLKAGDRVATKFTKFTQSYYGRQKMPIEVIKLNGSVELAPLLNLSGFIVDLVETGETIKANKLEIVANLASIKVRLIANPAYFKINYAEINKIVALLNH